MELPQFKPMTWVLCISGSSTLMGQIISARLNVPNSWLYIVMESPSGQPQHIRQSDVRAYLNDNEWVVVSEDADTMDPVE